MPYGIWRTSEPLFEGFERFVTDLGIPLPKRFQMAVDLTLNEDLLAAFSEDSPDHQRVHELLEEVKRTGVPLDTVTLEFALRKTMERSAERLQANPAERGALQDFDRVVALCRSLPFDVNLWAAQNAYYEVMQSRCHRDVLTASERGDSEATAWINTARSLGEILHVRANGSGGENSR